MQLEKKKRKGPAVQLSPVSQAMMRMKRLHDAIEGLELTEEQEEKHKKLHEELGPKMKATFEKIDGILTEEQAATAKEAAKAAKEAGKEGRAFFAAVESSIKIDDEQKEKLAAVGKELQAIQRAVMKKIVSSLTPEQKEKLKEKLVPVRKKKPVPAKE